MHLGELPALESLTLYNVNVEGAGLGDERWRRSPGSPTLRALSVGECGTTDAGVRHLEAMPQLTHLTLRQEGRLTDAALASVAKLKRLRHLGLSSYVGAVSYGRMASRRRDCASWQAFRTWRCCGCRVTRRVRICFRSRS